MINFLIEIFNVKYKNSDLKCSKKSRPFKIGLVTYTYHNALSPMARKSQGGGGEIHPLPIYVRKKSPTKIGLNYPDLYLVV